jgi:mRNA-degrading endonuclease RelE of RelBE toxin-antitoxin system
MDTRIATEGDHRRFGKALRHSKRGLWRYRVGVSPHVRDPKFKVTVLVVAIGHRSTSYE